MNVMHQTSTLPTGRKSPDSERQSPDSTITGPEKRSSGAEPAKRLKPDNQMEPERSQNVFTGVLPQLSGDIDRSTLPAPAPRYVTVCRPKPPIESKHLVNIYFEKSIDRQEDAVKQAILECLKQLLDLESPQYLKLSQYLFQENNIQVLIRYKQQNFYDDDTLKQKIHDLISHILNKMH